MCDNAVRSSLFVSLGILQRRSLQHNYLNLLHQAISTELTAVLSQDGSLNPPFQLSNPMHTGWAALQFGPYRLMTHIVWLSLYPNYISSAVLPCFLSVQNNLPFSEGAYLLLEISSLLLYFPPEAKVLSCCLLFSFSLLNSFLPRLPRWDILVTRSSAGMYLMLWENYCPCRGIICNPFIERVAFHMCLKFCLLGTLQFFLASSIIFFSLTVKQETLVAMN